VWLWFQTPSGRHFLTATPSNPGASSGIPPGQDKESGRRVLTARDSAAAQSLAGRGSAAARAAPQPEGPQAALPASRPEVSSAVATPAPGPAPAK
jgi:hypothetical protein